MNTCYTALFSNYEELKEPTVITPGWKYICYTDQPITSETWQIIKVTSDEKPQKLARYYKLTQFEKWERSFWIDASFIINTDLNLWWQKYFDKGFAAPKHPLRDCVYIEALDCIISKRGVKEQVQAQMEEYKRLGVPEHNGIIQSGILMRENKPEVISLCNDWWDELKDRSMRDQIAFAKVSMNYTKFISTYRFDYRRSTEFKYHFHYQRRGGAHVPMSR